MVPVFRALVFVLLASFPAAAFAKGSANSYAPVFQLGVQFFTGDDGMSLPGQMGYNMSFVAEQRKGMIRPTFGFDFQLAQGVASIGADSPDFTMFGAAFLGGLRLFPFTEGRFQPFIGGNGVFSWHLLKLGTAPEGVEADTKSLSYGYEVSAGVDLRFGSASGRAIRLQSSYYSLTSTLAEISGFQLYGFRLLLGMVF